VPFFFRFAANPQSFPLVPCFSPSASSVLFWAPPALIHLLTPDMNASAAFSHPPSRTLRPLLLPFYKPTSPTPHPSVRFAGILNFLTLVSVLFFPPHNSPVGRSRLPPPPLPPLPVPLPKERLVGAAATEVRPSTIRFSIVIISHVDRLCLPLPFDSGKNFPWKLPAENKTTFPD